MKDGLTLHVVKEDEMVIPVELLTSNLTLAEIGAVVCLLAMPNNTENEPLIERLKSRQLNDILKPLYTRGILTLSTEGKTINIGVDLNKI